MSRIGKPTIIIPEGVEMDLQGTTVSVKEPGGTITREFGEEITINIEGREVRLNPREITISTKALWGTYGAHLKNMLKGVVKSFEKQLILEGVGYRAEVSGDTLNLSIGFSHPVKVKIPQGLTVTAEKNTITIKGIDKEIVGRFAAHVRSLKKPEPYKGKGFRYSTEVIRRKEGKKTV